VTLARLHRAGELTGVWVPDARHEAVRDLVRAREATADDRRRKRQQLLSFLLRHGRVYSGGGHRTLAHRRWLATQNFAHPAQQIVFQEAIDAIADADQRLRRLEQQLAVIVPSWSMALVVDAYQAMRGASFLVAVTFAAEIGDVRRFDNPRQLMSFLGLVPAESDRIVDCDKQAGRLQTELDGSKLVKMADAGHMLHYSAPEQVVAVIRDTVQQGLAVAGKNVARAAE
jgi:transposase